jgi:hypothetical protein
MLYVFIEDISNDPRKFIVVSSVEPTDDNYDEVDSNCYKVPVPNNWYPSAQMNITCNVLRAGGAEFKEC